MSKSVVYQLEVPKAISSSTDPYPFQIIGDFGCVTAPVDEPIFILKDLIKEREKNVLGNIDNNTIELWQGSTKFDVYHTIAHYIEPTREKPIPLSVRYALSEPTGNALFSFSWLYTNDSI